MTSTSKKVVIAGYYGFGNTGDEAILSAMIQNLSSNDSHIRICVLSGNPNETSKIHGVEAIHWENIKKLISIIEKCDLIIIGGGGIFHDYWGVEKDSLLTSQHSGISFYMSLAILAELFNKAFILYAVGIGPLLTSAGKEFTKFILNQASIVMVRDILSKELAISLECNEEKIILTVDPIFCRDDWGNYQKSNILDKSIMDCFDLKKGSGPILGISIRNWDFDLDQSQWEKDVAAAIDLFNEEHGGTSIFIPFQEAKGVLLNDREISKRIQAQLKSKAYSIIIQDQSFHKKVDILSRCDIILGMRFHSILFAIKGSIPFVGLVYDPKVVNAIDQIGMNYYAIELKNITSKDIFSRLSKAFLDKTAISLSLQSIKEKLINDAKSNANLLKEGILNAQFEKHAEHSESNINIRDSILSLMTSLYESDKKLEETENELRLDKQQIQSMQEQIKSISESLEKQRLQSSRISKSNTKLLADLKNAELELNFLNLELLNIKNSRGWKLIWLLWKIRLIIFPKGSIVDKVILNHKKDKYAIGPKIIRLSRKHSCLMSKQAYAFYQYKKSRRKTYSSNLNSLKPISIKGLVSIILPVFNGEKYLREALDSILLQSYKMFELIVVNDGSTDSTRIIMEKYQKKDPRIKVIHQPNQKLPQALNNGFKIARGEFWTWTSHDNLLHSDFLERMVGYLQKNPAVDMCYANIDIIDENGKPLLGSSWYAGYQKPSGSQHIRLPEDTSELNTRPNNFIGGAFLYRNRLGWIIGDYSKNQFTREDYDYWMLVNSIGQLRHVNFRDPIYRYRFHSGSLTESDIPLGITSDRKYLMILDDFRRDFFLSPVIWYIQQGQYSDAEHEIIIEIKRLISECGHIVLPATDINKYHLAEYWVPQIYLAFYSNEIENLPQNLNPSILKTVVGFDSPWEDNSLDKYWDIKLFLNSDADLTKLDNRWVEVKDPKALVDVLDLKSKILQTRLIESEKMINNHYQKKISVIICTVDRKESLKKCLGSLLEQTFDENEFEILIVNNNPDKNNQWIDQIIETEKWKELERNVRVIDCPFTGLSHARNSGISEAVGEILVFLDDDSIADRDLLKFYWGAYTSHQDAGVIGGYIQLIKPTELKMKYWKPGWEKYWSQFTTEFSDYTEVQDWWNFPWGANWSARSEALAKIGGFRLNYGRKGDDYSGGEEIVAANQIKELGYKVAFLPKAKVEHDVDKGRFTLEHVNKTIHAGIFSHYEAQQRLHLPQESNLNGSIKIISTNLMELIKSLHKGNPDSKASLIEKKYYFSAYVKLFFRQFSDLAKRLIYKYINII